VADLYPLLVAERLHLADALDTLTDDQWNTPSLCAGWTARDVVAHLVFPATTSKLRVLVPFAKSGFNFDKMTTETARADRRSGPDLTKALRKHAEHRFTPPGFGFEAPLTDVLVHGRDLGRPLHLAPTFDPQSARAVLDFLMKKKATRAFVRKGLTDGLRFEATDLNWAYGDGPAVRGTAEAVMLAIAGRSIVLDDLSGEGVVVMRERAA
jgi:uncharacterized protein (TIGR03083 family)